MRPRFPLVRSRDRYVGALVFRRLRLGLLQSATGRVLEVARETGWNLGHCPAAVDITIIDLSPGMIAKMRRRGASKLAVVDAEHLAFRDGLFDTVVCNLGTCTFPGPVEALREMRRVCRPAGVFYFLRMAAATCRHRYMAGSPGAQTCRLSGLLVEPGTAGERVQGRVEATHRRSEFARMVHVIQSSN